jgi:hypothetical protein
MAVINNSTNSSTGNDFKINSVSNDGASETLDFQKSRAGGVITSGDSLGAVYFSGFDGTNYISGGRITSTSSGTIAAGRVAANLVFQTHPDSVSAPLTRLTIAPTGEMTIAAPDSGTALTIVNGGLTVSAGTISLPTLGGAGVMYINGSNAVSAISNGDDGQLLIGKTGGFAPIWANLTSSGGTITITNGANSINLEAVGAAATALTFSARKKTAGTINIGQLVYITSWNAGLSIFEIELADASDGAKMPAVGMATTSITAAATGTVLVLGTATSLDTSGASAGASLYVDATTPGAFTSTKPTGTGVIQFIGIVGRSNNGAGTIHVNPSDIASVPNIADDKIWVGSATGVATATALANGILTYDTTGNAFSGSTVTQYQVVVGGATNTVATIGSVGTATQVLQSGGVGANPVWSTATYPATTAQGDIIYSSATNTIGGLAKDASATRYVSNTGASNNPAWAQIDLSNGVTGTLVVANGGTGIATATAYAVLCGGTVGTNPFQSIASVGNAGEVLTSNGVGALPTFQAGGGGGITTLAGDSGTATGATVTIAGTASQITTSAAASTVTLSLPSAITTPGSLTATTTLTATSGAITSTNGAHIVGNTAEDTTTPLLDFKKSRSGSVITSGDLVGQVTFRGIATGTTYVEGASITSTSSGTIAANRLAANLVFATHPDSASGATATTRMTIASTGAITIATPDSGTALTISGGGQTITAGNLTLTSGLLALPTTSSTAGQVTINSARFLHGYGHATNTFVGGLSGNFTASSGDSNTGCGYNTLVARTSGTGNTAVGESTMLALTSGGFNTACGDFSLGNLTTGSRNTVLGLLAGTNYTGAESSNTLINNGGVVGESNKLRIGAATGSGNGELNKAFIHGIRGITTDAADAIDVLISSTGQLGTVSSSIRYKENVVDMSGASDRIYKLRPTVFNYKTHPHRTSYGLIAEEVETSFPELVAYNSDKEPESVKYHDLPVLLLNELQKMAKRIAFLEECISEKDR